MDLRSGTPLWLIKSGLLYTYPPLESDISVDVAVIGAGITGALCARRLTEAGASVAVLDGRDVGTGSTCASTGLLLHETDTMLVDLADRVGESAAVHAWKLGLDAVRQIGRLVSDLDCDCGFAYRPSLYLASRPRDVASLETEVALRQRHGFDVHLIERQELARRFSIDAPAALVGQGNGEVDAYRLTHALLTTACASGARVYDRTRVVDVEDSAAGVELRTERGPVVRARRLIWATGYEATRQLRRHAGNLNSTWVVATEPVHDLGPWSHRALIWETARPYAYGRVTDDGRVIVGGEDSSFSSRHENPRTLARKSRRLLSRLAAWFPELRVEMSYVWAGVFGTTEDGLPNIGPVHELEHTWMALGYGGNGITFSVIAANLLGDIWEGKPRPDAAIFDASRR